MTLKLFNTLTRKKENFKNIDKNIVKYYACGPTVYSYVHIGNLRAFTFADLLRRYLEYKGFKVRQVMNITDVDDKTIRASQAQKISLKKFTEKFTKAFLEDLKTLNILTPHILPKATDHIDDMVTLIKKLKKKGYTYESEKSLYYKISKFKNYGKLSKLDLKELKENVRITSDEYTKENAHDFALWKAWDESDGPVFWETELGKGRPGWHIECSAMSSKYLGEHFDIHTGGVDLIFPHHENEIAQSEAANGKKFVNYWLHNEHLLVDGKKMSKSLGNFYTLRDLLRKNLNPMAIRYELLSTHYRQPLNFTLKGVEASEQSIQRLYDFILRLNSANEKKSNPSLPRLIKEVKSKFEEHMDNDLNISSALAVVFNFVKDVNKLKLSKKDAESVRDVMFSFDRVFGLNLDKIKEENLSLDLKKLVDERERARELKDFAKADKIRSNLRKKGVILEDTPQGIRWKIVTNK